MGSGRSGNRVPDYLERQEAAIRAVYEVGAEYSYDVIVAGDMFDNKTVLPNELAMVVRVLTEMDGRGFRTLIVRGNHDQFGQDLTYLSTLDELARAHLQNTVVVYDRPEWVTLFDVPVLAVPGFNTDFNEAVDAALARWDGGPIVCVGHELFKGCTADNGFVLQAAGHDRLIPHDKVLYYAFGDLHTHQQVPGCPRAWYCGAPVMHRYSDHADKGFLLVDTDRPTAPTFIPLHAAPELRTVTSLQEALRKEHEGHYLRLVYDPRTPPPDELPANVICTVSRGGKLRSSDAAARQAVLLTLEDPLGPLAAFLSDLGIAAETATLAEALADRFLEELVVS